MASIHAKMCTFDICRHVRVSDICVVLLMIVQNGDGNSARLEFRERPGCMPYS